MPVAEAKHAVLEAVGGNKDLARAHWDEMVGDEPPTRTAIAEVVEGLTSATPSENE